MLIYTFHGDNVETLKPVSVPYILPRSVHPSVKLLYLKYYSAAICFWSDTYNMTAPINGRNLFLAPAKAPLFQL